MTDVERTDESPNRTLNGWKEIGAYLGKSVRSVQRWEATLGLPVHRIRTPDGQIVYAESSEIDAWRRQLDHDPPQEPDDPAAPVGETSDTIPAPDDATVRWWRLRAAAAALLLFTAGTTVGWWLRAPSNAAVDVKLVGRQLEAIGRDGSVAWTHVFDTDVNVPPRGPAFVDLDGDGEVEILVPVHHTNRSAGVPISDALYCFTRDGEVKWKVAPDHQLSFGDRTYGAPWQLRDFVVAVTPAPRRVWIAFAHHTWFPGFALEVDPAGRAELKYVQSGALYSIAHWMTPSGGMLAIGGTSEEHARATIVLMPDDAEAAIFPTSGAPRLVCHRCPTAQPRRILMIAAAELTGANREVFPYVIQLRSLGGDLKATLRDGPGTSIVELNSDFSLKSMQFGQHYWGAHRELEAKGRLSHSAEDCPDRSRPREVSEWTPWEGWRTRAVAPQPDDTGTPRPKSD